MKLKKRGYILFEYWDKQIRSFDLCDSMRELKLCHANNLDDKWDLEGRNKIHYFYLSLSTGKYIALEKWAHDINKEDRFESSDKYILSTKTF